ncbi:MAG TPA: NADP-dependent oxidoreductase, partial [Bryobacteraceae bacterium]|nr:NADP-dependent oxidoreductase [Bryobacteraceae bacterium]
MGAARVNPIDWKTRRGDLKAMVPVQFPAIPGRDFAGEVVEVGPGVSNFKPGQKVMGVENQTYAEYVSVPSANVTAIPDGLGLEEAGALPLVATTGSELIDRIAPKRGATVVVTGALGSVGRAAVYAAKQRGARVIAGVRESQKKAAESLGADQVVAIDKDPEIALLPELDAIADTVSGDVIGKLIPKLKHGVVLGSVLGKPKAAEGKDIRVEAIVAQPNPQNLSKFAEAAR